MSPAYFFEAVKQRYRILAGSILALVLLALIVNILLPKKYESTVSLVLNYKGIDPVTGDAFSPQLVPGYMATQIDIIESKNVAMKVAYSLNLLDHEYYLKRYGKEVTDRNLFAEWIAHDLMKTVKVKPSRESGVISISIKLRDPALAAAVANGFAQEYQKTTTELKEEPLRKVSAYLRDRIAESRDRLEKAQAKLAEFQSQKGITNGESTADYETARLNELSTQLVLSQVQTMEAGSRHRQVQNGMAHQLPEVLSSSLIQNLKGLLAQAESRLAQVGQQLTPEHPNYQKTKAEVQALRNELNQHIRAATNSVTTNLRIHEKREFELREALAAQVTKVMELNRSRNEIALMVKEIQSEHRAYDMAGVGQRPRQGGRDVAVVLDQQDQRHGTTLDPGGIMVRCDLRGAWSRWSAGWPPR